MKKWDSYETMVSELKKRGAAIAESMTAERASVWHAATGIVGEAGELIDGIKKWVVYNKPLDRENMIEELGDLEFYMEGLRQALEITREECLIANMKKLGIRYNEGYTDKAAQQRADKA